MTVEINGTIGDDIIDGSDSSDLIHGFGGNDIIDGGSSPGVDTLVGGAGDDTIYGSSDSVAEYSGSISQYFVSYAAWSNTWTVNDQVAGRDGNDKDSNLENLQFADVLVTKSSYVGPAIQDTTGPDVIVGTSLSEYITANLGNDSINAGAGGDYITMGDGNDTVDAGSGDDYIYDTTLDSVPSSSMSGNDMVIGGLGDDWFIETGGQDTFNGGAGRDTLQTVKFLSTQTIGAFVNLNSGIAQGEYFTTTLISVENVYGSELNDTLIGNDQDNFLFGFDGTDSIEGGNGNDLISGGAGIYRGGAGNDTIESTSGTMYGDDGNDSIRGGNGSNLIFGGTGNDIIKGGNGVVSDTLHGEEGSDTLDGGNGDDAIDGGAGVDFADYGFYARSAVSFSGNAHSASVTIVSDTVQADTLTDVERLIFADTKVALDLDGNAGSTVRILGALLGADASHSAGIIGIGLSYFDAGMSESAVAAFAASVFYTGYSDDAYVKTLYTNVIHSAPSQDTADIFTSLLHNGMSRGDLLILAAHTSYNDASIGFTGLAETGVAYL